MSVAAYLAVFIAAIVGAVVGVKSLYKQKAEPTEIAQPLHTKMVHDFATRPELMSLETKMDNELGRERGARKKIHEEIAAIQSSVSSIRTETGKQSIDLGEMKHDIKTVSSVASSTEGKIELMNVQLHQITNHILSKKQ